MPRVSVLLPAYNASRYVAGSIESILSQTFQDFELIVVDDGSTDGTLPVLERYARDSRVRIVALPTNRGIAGALNAGLAEANGELIARQDADDVSLPDRFARQIAFLDAHPDVVVVGTASERLAPDGTVTAVELGAPTDTLIRWGMCFRCALGHSSVILRAEPVRAHDLRYDPARRTAEDFDFFSNLLEHGRAAIINVPLVRVRDELERWTRVAGDDVLRGEREEIAYANVRKLGVQVAEEDFLRAHRLHSHPPPRFGPDELRAVGVLLDIVEALCRRPGSDPEELRPVVRNLIDMTLVRSGGSPGPLLRSGLPQRFLRRDPLWVASSPVRWLARRAPGGAAARAAAA